MDCDFSNDPTDLPPGTSIKRPDPASPTVSLSSRFRWSVCPASAVLPQLRTPSGPAAEEGTEAHKVAEWAMQSRFKSANTSPVAPDVIPPAGLDRFDYSPQSIADWQRTVRTHAEAYAAGAAALFSDTRDALAMTELRLEPYIAHGVQVRAVTDATLWSPSARRLVIGDYKYGRSPVGVGTVCDPNAQCAGAAVMFTAQTPGLQVLQVGLFVHQPRIRFGEPFQTLAPLGPEWLQGQRNKLDAELQAIADAAACVAIGEAPKAVAGDHCTYCPSARWCPAAAGYGAAAVAVDAGRKAVVDLTPAEVMALWAQRSAFKQFEDDLKERVKMLHEANDPAVTARRRTGSQMWSRPADVVELLMFADRADLLQPPSIEKVRTAGIAEADLADLITRAPDVMTYVATDGKQPAVASSAFAKYVPQGSPFA